MPVTTDYKPRTGSIADRAIDHLLSLPDGTEVMTTALAEAIHCPPLTLTPCLEAPVKHGVIFRRQRDTHPRSPWWWSATDHSAKPKTEPVRMEVPPIEIPQFLPAKVVNISGPVFPNATTEGAKAAHAPVVSGARATPNDGRAQGMRIALWSEGRLEVRRTADDLLLFTPDEARQLVAYLDRVLLEQGAAA